MSSNSARALRKRPTWGEKLMWRWLRDRRFKNYKFHRQHPMANYCLDFFCEEARLSIELDGFEHGHPLQQAYDSERARYLETLGIKELRFWNWQLRREKQAVRDAIFNALQKRAPHPLPNYTRPGIVGCKANVASSPSPLPSPPEEGERSDAFGLKFGVGVNGAAEKKDREPTPKKERLR